MRANLDHVHVQLATRQDLLSEGRFMSLLERVEAFNGGSPFTLCRNHALDTDDVNLTAAVRRSLGDQLWLPEAGIAQIGFAAPANGRGLWVDLRLPVEPGPLGELHVRMDTGFFSGNEVERSLDLVRELVGELALDWGSVHHALDEAVQDTTDAKQYRALTGQAPPSDPIDVGDHPGRSVRLDGVNVAVRWVSIFGGQVLSLLGRDRVGSSPCAHETLPGGEVMLRLYDDPLAYALPEHRHTQRVVRQHLALDAAAEGKVVEAPQAPTLPRPRALEASALERRAAEEPVATDWGSEDLDLADRPGEVDFYLAESRSAGGPVLVYGCGDGRLVLALARAGVQVTAVEATAARFQGLRAQLGQEPATIAARVVLSSGEIRQLGGSFGAVFLPQRIVNRLTRPGELRGMLEQAHAVLSAGGGVILNTFHPDRSDLWPSATGVGILRHRGRWPQREGTLVVTDYPVINRVAQTVSLLRRTEEVDGQGQVRQVGLHEVVLRWYFPDELRHLMERCGFEAQIFGGFQRQNLETVDQEVVLVGRKR